MLDDLLKLADSINRFDTERVIVGIIDDNKEKIVDLQKEQLLEGMGADGQYIRPFYSENPYFKSLGAAMRYAKWKQVISPNPKRPEDVPNLFINGYLHNSLFVDIQGQTVDIDSTVPFADEVFSVHKNAIGLDESNRKVFAETVTLPEFAKVFEQQTGVKI